MRDLGLASDSVFVAPKTDVKRFADDMAQTGMEETKLRVEPPSALSRPLKIPERSLMGPGPSNCSPRVLRALSNQVLGHLHPETCQLMDEIKEGLRYAFQTRNSLTLAISGSGHAGMEACLGNLLEPGETVLIAKCGIWGERATDMATRLGARVEWLLTKMGVPFTLEELESAVKKYRPAVVFVVHGESSTGMKQPLQGLGEIVHRYGGLLVVDAVASLGGEPFFMDAWSIDAAYTGSQKVLGAPAGITPVSFSNRARSKIFSRKTKVPVYYWDVTLLADYWGCSGNSRIYHHTISATLVYGLREALAILAEEGLEACWRRHAAVKKQIERALLQRKLQFYIANPEHRLATVIAIKVPLGVDAKVVSRVAVEKFEVELSGGLGPTLGQIFRIGLMGTNATPRHVDLVVKALDEGLKFATSHKL
ncbi:alanine--glyoxylate aminotransferase [Venturia canescens]|uniref:alanine--glyoxylate aminotransferase n=1 Tax=Venturia canescens TaxID=32260 RepID=UPI001C9C75F7|nr:alanine--glyoxylate aminotransferase [Venturia canescens]